MSLSPQQKMNINKVLVITLGFVLINVFIALLINSAITSSYSLGPSPIYSLVNYIWLSALVGLLAGSLGGIALISINKYYFRKKSFRYAMGVAALLYSSVFILVNVVNTIISTNLRMDNPGLKDILEVWMDISLNPLTLIIYFMWWVISIFTLFLLQMSDKLGPGVLWKFIRGQYFKPKEEDRIFMFADMRSSTTIAEKIGHKQYFNLLSDLFADITDTILNHEGEIYQYVGDEIIISWTLNKGVRKANCLNCFLQIEKKLIELAPAYQAKYGVSPELKAGVHHGSVMAGEIGIIKKDIIYSGDVLNTTARIQEQCNHYNVNLLISDDTLDLLNIEKFKVEPLGSFELRGKENIVKLNTVKER